MRRDITYSIALIYFITQLIFIILLSSHTDRIVVHDAIGYNNIAKNIIQHNCFSMSAEKPLKPDNIRTPLYPLFIAGIYKIFGESPQCVLIFQAILSSIIIILTSLLFEKIFSSSGSYVVPTLIALAPILTIYTLRLWSDLLFTFFLLLSVLFFTDTLNKPRRKNIVLSALFMGIATLTHPRSLYLPFVIVIFLFSKKQKLKTVIINVFIYILIFNMILLPWRIRNKIVFGIPNLTSIAGINMLYYSAALLEEKKTGKNLTTITKELKKELEDKYGKNLNEAEKSKFAFKLGIKKILSSPFNYIKLHLLGMIKIFFPPTFSINSLIVGKYPKNLQDSMWSAFINQNIFKNPLFKKLLNTPLLVKIIILYGIIFNILLYFSTLLSLVKLFKLKIKTKEILFLLATIFYLCIVTGIAGAPRFRLPFLPFLVVISSFIFLQYPKEKQIYEKRNNT